MVDTPTTYENGQSSQHNNAHLLYNIARQEYGDDTAYELKDLVEGVIALYAGKWPSHEACRVGYHTVDHALDVTLAAARMAAGWNMTDKEQPLPESVFLAGLAAALFHDSGYIKDKGDTEGAGGKYTFSHVTWSMKLAQDSLATRWSKERAQQVGRMILHTDFLKDSPATPQSAVEHEMVMARMVATADLIAQMADVDYLANIHELFKEFEEAYRFEGRQSLAARGIQLYSSVQEILDGTLTFYKQFVVPRLENLGRMDRYLNAFFIDGRNPYQENIAANISYHYTHDRPQWQRLGEILEQLGVVSHAQIVQAVRVQAGEETATAVSLSTGDSARSDQLLAWAGQKPAKQRLGEILLAMKAIDQEGLCQGLIAQTLPPALLERLSCRELAILLQVAVLLQNISQGVTVLEYLKKITATFMGESGAVRMFDMEARETVSFVATGALVGSGGVRLPLDKNLAGWVQRYGQPVKINHDQLKNPATVDADRFDSKSVQSVLMTPLLVNGEQIGVLELVNKNDENFTEHETAIVACLANIIGSSLSNFLLGAK